MKPFDLEAAKRGEPVINGLGLNVRILCFDKKGSQSICALVHEYNEHEEEESFNSNGQYFDEEPSENDLFMAPKKIKLYSVLYKNKNGTYDLTVPSIDQIFYYGPLSFVKAIEIEVEE